MFSRISRDERDRMQALGLAAETYGERYDSMQVVAAAETFLKFLKDQPQPKRRQFWPAGKRPALVRTDGGGWAA